MPEFRRTQIPNSSVIRCHERQWIDIPSLELVDSSIPKPNSSHSQPAVLPQLVRIRFVSLSLSNHYSRQPQTKGLLLALWCNREVELVVSTHWGPRTPLPTSPSGFMELLKSMGDRRAGKVKCPLGTCPKAKRGKNTQPVCPIPDRTGVSKGDPGQGYQKLQQNRGG